MFYNATWNVKFTYVERGGRVIKFVKANPIVTCLTRRTDFPVITINVLPILLGTLIY